MLCIECGAKTEKGFTTDVTDLGMCLVIVDKAKKMMQEISIIDYSKVA